MDFILKKLDNRIAISEECTVEMQTLLRERIEYIFYLVLGCLWNESVNMIEGEKISKILENLYKMSIGEVVAAIRILDREHKYISRKDMRIFDKYPSLRNEAMGHGYTHGDNEMAVEDALKNLYEDLKKIDFIKREFDIVYVEAQMEEKYIGIRFANESGIPTRWSCPKEILEGEWTEKSIFLLDAKMNYYRITPFVAIEDKGESIYVFQSLVDKLSGCVKMSQLFRSGTVEICYKELIMMAYESERRRISANGTIMNYFDKNYGKYINVAIEKKINHFLSNNRANVQATIWGHGGVGKTACIQNVCLNKFNGIEREFSYVVFLSAKDRMLDPKTGEIIEIKNLRSYEEIIDSIIAVVFDENSKGENIEYKEERIFNITSKVLLVIDDYETFPDNEKEKIQEFINHLNIDYFKVVITTRNRRLSTGVEISSDEFKGEETKKFLLDIFAYEYRQHLEEIRQFLLDENMMQNIQEATSGRAIFLYQFANLYVQKGFKQEFLKELKDSSNAQEFLYGKIYSYLGEMAKDAFVCIAQITNEKDYIFKHRVLEYLLSENDSEDVAMAIEELSDQKVIEQYDEEHYRVYSKELFNLMQKNYNERSMPYKDKIKNKLLDIGGKDISGTVYEAMLNEANMSRNQGNAKLTVEKYKRLMNDKKCEVKVKKKALMNLASYMAINLLDMDGAIRMFDEYYGSYNFRNDIDITKLYTQYLWSSDDKGREKACTILERYFRNKSHKKTAQRNLELFAIAVTYCISNVLERPEPLSEGAPMNNAQRIFNEYGKELYDYIIEKQLSEFRPSVKHNISLGLIQTAKLAIALTDKGVERMEYGNRILEFGEDQFNELFRRQLKKIRGEMSQQLYRSGEVVDVTVTYSMNYGILVKLEGGQKGLIHISGIPYTQRGNYKRGDKIRAKVIEKTVKGYSLTLRGII